MVHNQSQLESNTSTRQGVDHPSTLIFRRGRKAGQFQPPHHTERHDQFWSFPASNMVRHEVLGKDRGGLTAEDQSAYDVELRPFRDKSPSAVLLTRGLWVVGQRNGASQDDVCRAIDAWISDAARALPMRKVIQTLGPIRPNPSKAGAHPTISPADIELENRCLRDAAQKHGIETMDTFSAISARPKAGQSASIYKHDNFHWALVKELRATWLSAAARTLVQ